MFIVGIIVVVALVVAIAIVAQKQAEKRRQELRALATELGLSFNPGQDRSLDDKFSQFAIFNIGRSRVAYNTLSGDLEIDEHRLQAIAGDYRYTVTRQSGKNRSSRTYRLSYLLVGMPYPSIPKLLVRSENFFDKLAGFVGFDDIDFESIEFSRKFHVSSSNKRFAYDLIDPRMMEFLMQSQEHTLDMEHGWLLLVDGKRRWAPPEFKSRINWLGQWMRRWPDHVVKSLKAGEYSNGETG